MSRLTFRFFAVAAFSAFSFVASSTWAQQAAIPAPVAPAPVNATPMPNLFQSAATHAVPDVNKQNGMARVQSLYGQPQRYVWTFWGSAEPIDKNFLAERDPKLLVSIKPRDLMYFTKTDVDGDKIQDMIMRYGSADTCSIGPNGCPYVIYFGDKTKSRTIINARKLVPTKMGGFIIHNKYYDIRPTGGDTYTAISYRSFRADRPIDPISIGLYDKLKTVFPSFYEGAGRPPGLRYTLYDLNGDGKNEIILTIMEDDEEWEIFCSKDDKLSCPVLIYSTGANNIPDKLIGFFRSRQDLIIGRKGSGYADILTTGMLNGGLRTYVYSMDPKTGQYAPQ